MAAASGLKIPPAIWPMRGRRRRSTRISGVSFDRSRFAGSARRAFAGCISATANVNSDCVQSYHRGDAAALDAAVTIRKLFEAALGSGREGSCPLMMISLGAVCRRWPYFRRRPRAVVSGYDQVQAKRVA